MILSMNILQEWKIKAVILVTWYYEQQWRDLSEQVIIYLKKRENIFSSQYRNRRTQSLNIFYRL